MIPGTDGLEFDWQDSVQLNYRKKSTWDLLVHEISEWAAKVGDMALSHPLIHKRDHPQP